MSSKRKHQRNNKEEITTTQITQSIEYQGILPPPNILEGFEKVLPGAAERIVQMAEKQIDHRLKSEDKELESIIKTRNKISNYPIYAFIIILVLIISSVILILKDKQVEGLLTLAGTMAMATFNYVKRNK